MAVNKNMSMHSILITRSLKLRLRRVLVVLAALMVGGTIFPVRRIASLYPIEVLYGRK